MNTIRAWLISLACGLLAVSPALAQSKGGSRNQGQAPKVEQSRESIRLKDRDPPPSKSEARHDGHKSGGKSRR